MEANRPTFLAAVVQATRVASATPRLVFLERTGRARDGGARVGPRPRQVRPLASPAALRLALAAPAVVPETDAATPWRRTGVARVALGRRVGKVLPAVGETPPFLATPLPAAGDQARPVTALARRGPTRPPGRLFRPPGRGDRPCAPPRPTRRGRVRRRSGVGRAGKTSNPRPRPRPGLAPPHRVGRVTGPAGPRGPHRPFLGRPRRRALQATRPPPVTGGVTAVGPTPKTPDTPFVVASGRRDGTGRLLAAETGLAVVGLPPRQDAAGTGLVTRVGRASVPVAIVVVTGVGIAVRTRVATRPDTGVRRLPVGTDGQCLVGTDAGDVISSP